MSPPCCPDPADATRGTVDVRFADEIDIDAGTLSTESVDLAVVVRVGFADPNLLHPALWELVGGEDRACDGARRPVEGDRPDEAIANGFPALPDDLTCVTASFVYCLFRLWRLRLFCPCSRLRCLLSSTVLTIQRVAAARIYFCSIPKGTL